MAQEFRFQFHAPWQDPRSLIHNVVLDVLFQRCLTRETWNPVQELQFLEHLVGLVALLTWLIGEELEQRAGPNRRLCSNSRVS